MTIRVLLIGLGAGVGALLAQNDRSDWSRVAGLAAGTRVEVIHGNLKRLQGSVVAASSGDITVQTRDTRETVGKGDVLRISIAEGSRKKRALLGMALGAAAGGVALAAGAQAGDIDIRRDVMAGAGAAAGGGIGALIGAATGGPRTIYRRR